MNVRTIATKWQMSWAQNCEMSALGRSKGLNWLSFLDNACAKGIIQHKTPQTLTFKEYESVKAAISAL